MAEARGRGVDQLGILRVQRLPAVAQLLHRAGPEVLDHDVGLLEQLLEDLAVGVVLEVERDAFLAAIDRGEVGRLAVDERPIGAGVVAALGRLDLDHPRAHLGHQQGAVGAGEDARQVDDDGCPTGGLWNVWVMSAFLASGPARIQPGRDDHFTASGAKWRAGTPLRPARRDECGRMPPIVAPRCMQARK